MKKKISAYNNNFIIKKSQNNKTKFYVSKYLIFRLRCEL